MWETSIYPSEELLTEGCVELPFPSHFYTASKERARVTRLVGSTLLPKPSCLFQTLLSLF